MSARRDPAPPTRDVVPFLVLKLPRTGSTMFGRVLDAHPAVSCRNEYLDKVSGSSRAERLAAFRAFYDGSSGAGPDVQALGQTMNPFKYKLTAADLAAGFGPAWLGWTGRRLSARFRRLPVRVIVLTRENHLKQAVSHYLSRQRGDFTSSLHRVKDPSVLHDQVVDVPALVEQIRKTEQLNDRLRRLAARLRAPQLHVSYEEVQSDREAAFRSIFDFLGVAPPPPGFDYTAGTEKMLSDDLRDVIANFDDVAREPALARYL